jgi:pimeloyl-ACP methyl ester carboxylesterase
MPPAWAANALLHPPRRPVTQVPARPHENVDYDVGVHLRGWLFRTDRPRRGLLVYLHGVGDNRESGIGVAAHFNALGFDVLTYDSRAHGESGGDACTYGYYEKKDLSRGLDQLGGGPVLALGVSLGAAVALQAAADDPRIAAVVAVSSFSDLRTVGAERAPFFASRGNIAKAFELAEAEAAFRADEVSPVAAAARIRAPVLLVHGADDRDTRPAHSERIYAALPGPKRLVLVPGAGHNDVLNAGAWHTIDEWVAANWPVR